MTPPPQTLAVALLMLRVTLGLFFLQWGIEKFVVPATTTGIFRNFYGLVAMLHTVTVLVTIPRLLAPWNPVSNHFFIAGVPILAAFYALYLLRDADLYTLPRLLRGTPARA